MKEKKGEHPYGDAGQILFLILFLIVWVLDSFFLKKSTVLAGYIPLSLRLGMLVIAMLLGFYLARSGHVVVRHEERPARVVATGAFRYVRHPLYLACLLFYIGLTVSTASLLSLALLIIIFLFYNYIAGYEERLLDKKFGDDYARFCRKTGKWIPGIGKRS